MTDYLVQYGRPAFVGRFACPADLPVARGDRVVVRSPRGLELGVVLCEPAARFAHQMTPDGELVRPAGPNDRADADRDHRLLIAADRLAAATDVPVTFLDAEVLLDGTSAVLHAVVWGEADLTPLLDAVSRDVGLTVRLHDTGRTPVATDAPESNGCGKPGCGSESGGGCGTGGGCSTGSCSRGAVKSADELSAYFADLRTKMDAHFRPQRTALN